MNRNDDIDRSIPKPLRTNQRRVIGTSRSSSHMGSQIGTTLTIGKNSHSASEGIRSDLASNTMVIGRRNFTDGQIEYTNPKSIQEPDKESIRRQSNTGSNLEALKESNEQIQLTVWFHELRTSIEDVIIDVSVIPGLKEGDICELIPSSTFKSDRKPKRLIFIVKNQSLLSKDSKLNALNSNNSSNTSPAMAPTTPNNANNNTNNTKAKTNFQISLLSNPLQGLMDLPPRSLVQVKTISDIGSIEADTIEIFIKDVNLSRDLMWAFSSSLVGTCVYTDKRLAFLSNRNGVVKKIYKNGKEIFSGLICEKTKVVFRSKSAKLVFLVQLSREMWHFEETGEIMFHKLVNTLFPKIFKKWRDKNTHHAITIVLFTSVDLTNIPWTSLGQGERPNNRRDYFRVVVDQVSIFHWDRIMANLRLEFANFKRDIMLNCQPENDGQFTIAGQTLPSVKGNVLEAINVGIHLVSDRFKNTDLKHSLNHFILITPGTGLFDVDYNLMYETSRKMQSIDCALDIVCLSQPPLHIVPLFRYKDPSKNEPVSHCVPHWCDISFYKDSTANSTQWIPHCKIYELQMMGVMENEINCIEIERYKDPDAKSMIDSMDRYDDNVFRPANEDLNSTLNPKTSDYSLNSSKRNSLVTTPQETTNALSLIWNSRTSLLPNSSTAKIDVSTTNSSVLGTVTNNLNVTSALSSLYSLNKTSTDKVPTSTSSNKVSSGKSLKEGSIIEESNNLKRRTHMGLRPKLQRQDEIFKSDDSTNHTSKQWDLLDSKTRNKQSSTNIEEEVEKMTNLLWTDIPNPSKEQHSDMLSFLRLSRWNDVFPSNIKRRLVKWRSFESPAALPVTTSIFPSIKQLETEYSFQIYSVFLNSENDLEIRTTHDLMREMIQMRLLLGFQVCYSDQVKKFEAGRKPSGNAESLIKYFPKGSCFGAKIYMSLDDEIHRIYCDYNGNLYVQMYIKTEKAKTGGMLGIQDHKLKSYRPLIRTRYVEEYWPVNFDFLNTKPLKYNWNQFDQLIAGYDDAMPPEKKEFHKMKFVVLPANIPKNAYFISNENLTDEEIRVEGLRKLIATIERGKFTTSDDAESNRKEEILPEISFYTGNLYEFLSDQAETYDTTGNEPTNSLMLGENMRFTKNIKLSQLAHELQSPTGVRLVDRTWHFKRHLHCFLGNELVSWFIECFEDIDSRNDATSYGQTLMDRGMFKHVESRHGFLDGYYFYKFEDEYFEKPEKSTSGWFNRMKSTGDKGSTVTSPTYTRNNSDTESMKSPTLSTQDNLDLKRITSNTVQQMNDSEASSVAASSTRTKQKKKFILSRSVKFNADPLKKSFRPEIVTVHYDRVHNPEHCYHIRLQWLNTTTKFIDDTISNWSRLCERHGLRLVETPWLELCTIPEVNPFHSFVDLKLAINPWTDPEFLELDILKDNKFYYHLYLMKKSDFLLDNRSTVFFLKDHIEISYSWGKPIFQYAQYIHKTGAYIVELRDNGDLFLAPNNIHITRLNTSLLSVTEQDNIKMYKIDSQKVMLKFRSACTNDKVLRTIFREAKENWREKCLENVLPAIN